MTSRGAWHIEAHFPVNPIRARAPEPSSVNRATMRHAPRRDGKG